MRRHGENNPHRLDRLSEVRILGIDPGSITCGYGIIETSLKADSRFQSVNGARRTQSNPRIFESSNPVYITSGRIALSPKSPLHLKLKKLCDTLIEIIREHNPHEVVVEKVFFAKSAKAALCLGQARGIALLAAASCGLTVYEYSALEVKKAITGYGRAEKRQVQEMVMRILSLKPHIHNLSEDSADALALALCHLNTLKFKEAYDRVIKRKTYLEKT